VAHQPRPGSTSLVLLSSGKALHLVWQPCRSGLVWHEAPLDACGRALEHLLGLPKITVMAALY
jgi:hypothetical protein